MEWAYPEHLQFLLILPFAFIVYLFRSYWRRENTKKWFDKQSAFISSHSSFKRHFKVALFLLALIFFILSYARPQGFGEKQEIKSAGVQMILAVDVSQSMLAEDIKPNRLSFVKKELSQLLNSLQGHQIALMAFSGSSVLVSPFTNDISAIKLYLNDLSPDYLSQTGTDFSLLFSKAEDVFGRFKTKKDQSIAKVLVVASDGEDHSRHIKNNINKLIKNNIRVFTLSVGTKEGSVIPIKDRTGTVVEYKKDSSQQVVVSKLNPETLKDFARRTKGAYYHMDYGQNTVSFLNKDLDQLKKTVFKTSSSVKKKEYFQWFLFIGFLFALVELFIGDRRHASKTK